MKDTESLRSLLKLKKKHTKYGTAHGLAAVIKKKNDAAELLFSPLNGRANPCMQLYNLTPDLATVPGCLSSYIVDIVHCTSVKAN